MNLPERSLPDPAPETTEATRLSAAESALEVAFQDRTLLRQALTHRSYINEAGLDSRDANERLEFLGDALLGFLVAEWLYRRFPDLPEGALTARRVALIRTDTLARWSRQLGIAPLLYLSKGETVPDQLSDRVLANAFEALLAAIYLDAGIGTARDFLERRLVEADALIARLTSENYKGRLQELMQDPALRPAVLADDPGVPVGNGRFTPIYVVVARGLPATETAFTVEVRVEGRTIGVGEGTNKRLAEQAAARDALVNLEAPPHYREG